MDTDKWLNTDEAAAYCGYSVHTIRDAAYAGELVGHRRPGSAIRGRYRFRVEDLDRWLTSASRRRKAS
jgi:excisionase family DNA binding protein